MEGSARNGGPTGDRGAGRRLVAAAAISLLALAPLLPRAAGAAETTSPDDTGALAGDAVGGEAPLGTARVIGGSASVPGRWPSVVALVRAGFGSPADRQFCGGTVVAPRWVLTAAHCLYDVTRRTSAVSEPADIRVISGVTDLRAERADERVVVSAFVHPGYDHVAQDAYDDIALIEVASELDVPPAPLFAGDSESLAFAPGVVVGWGATEFPSAQRAIYPDALHDAVVPLVPRDTCNDPLSYAGYVQEGQLCAGFAEGGVDTCVGDSGGPLFVDTGERIEQVGVVSYGRGCAEPLFYGIYTDVAAYRPWIDQYAGEPERDAGEPERRSDSGGGAVGLAGFFLLSGALVGRCFGRRRAPLGSRSARPETTSVPARRARVGGWRAARPRRWATVLVAAIGAVALAGCAHATELALPRLSAQTETVPPSATLAGGQLRARRDAVLEAVARIAGGDDPQCRFSRLAPIDGSRRAFPVERCEHLLRSSGEPAPSLGGRPLEALVTRFVDERLVRLDVRLRPVASTPDATGAAEANLEARLVERLGEGEDEGDGTVRWSLGEDVVEYRRADAGEDGGERLSVFDGALIDLLPGLAGDDEADVE